MNSKIPRRIKFDPEDLAPVSKNDDIVKFKKIDPKKWAEAPEFIPRKHLSTNINNSEHLDKVDKVDESMSGNKGHKDIEFHRFLHDLNSTDSPDVNHLHDPSISPFAYNNFNAAHCGLMSTNSFVPACFPFPSTFVPQGYSANITTLNGNGLPIATIILKKKRKRRNRRAVSQRISIGAQTDFQQQISSIQSSQSNKQDQQSVKETTKPVQINDSIEKFQLLSVNSDPELFSKTKMDQSLCLMSNKSNELNGNTSGSCPDLSDEQLKLWDEILFKAVQNEREALDHKTEFITKNRRKTVNSVPEQPPINTTTININNSSSKRARSNTPMQTSIYEICAPVDVDIEMEQSEEDCDFNGNLAANSSKCQVITTQSPLTSPASSKENETSDSSTEVTKSQTDTQKLTQKLRKELEDLHFRNSYEWHRSDGKVVKINTNPLFDAVSSYPQHQQYPQDDFVPTHMSNFDPKRQSFASTSLPNGHVIHPEECSFEADYFENMNIRVNPFEESNDIVLDEYDCPPASRFQQLQWAIQRQKERYNEQLQIPQRVCCSIM